MAQYMCGPCGWIYDEDVGDPEHGLPAGTKFEDIPDDWKCPECGVGKEKFQTAFVCLIVSGRAKQWFQPL